MPATDSPAKRRGGRPKKIEAERRCKQTNHRWTIAEDAFLREQAAAADLSVAEFIRRRALLIPVVPPRKKVDARLLMELNAIGNNVNQLARDYNSDRQSAHSPDWREVQRRLKEVLDTVAEAFDD